MIATRTFKMKPVRRHKKCDAALTESFAIKRCRITPRFMLAVVIILCHEPLRNEAEEWYQFRGQNSAGIGTGSPPKHFDSKTNVLWSTDVAPGHSSPCIHGNRLFLTTFNSDQSTVSVVCFNRHDGDLLWIRSFTVEALEKGHPSFNPASSSPCCDSQNVIAYFGCYGLICLTHDGQVQWEKRMPLAKSFGGNATSPVIHEDNVILYRGNYVDHYIACFDKGTGDQRWKVQQTEKFTGEMACTACPIVHDDVVIFHSARSVQAFDINSGQRIWIAQCATTATSTPIIARNEVLVSTWNKLGEPDLRPPLPAFSQLISDHDANGNGMISRDEFPSLWIFHRPEGIEAPMNGASVSFKHCDKNSDGEIREEEWTVATNQIENFRDGYETHGLLAIPLNSKGLIDAEDVRVLTTRGIPEVPSPVAWGPTVYLIKNGGQLSCIDIGTGDVTKRMRTQGSGTHYASPVIADGHLYCFAGDGCVSVIQLNDSKSVIAVNELNDNVYATPAIVDGVIYLRTHKKLFAFKEKTRELDE